MATEKYPLHSVRLDDQVWQAVKMHTKSLNQILRDALGLNGEPPPPEPQPLANRPFKGPIPKPKDRKGGK